MHLPTCLLCDPWLKDLYHNLYTDLCFFRGQGQKISPLIHTLFLQAWESSGESFKKNNNKLIKRLDYNT